MCATMIWICLMSKDETNLVTNAQLNVGTGKDVRVVIKLGMLLELLNSELDINWQTKVLPFELSLFQRKTNPANIFWIADKSR